MLPVSIPRHCTVTTQSPFTPAKLPDSLDPHHALLGAKPVPNTLSWCKMCSWSPPASFLGEMRVMKDDQELLSKASILSNTCATGYVALIIKSEAFLYRAERWAVQLPAKGCCRC